jgi:exopolysaccharide biosynthesis polyprenyl glycosylphosphotransferase
VSVPNRVVKTRALGSLVAPRHGRWAASVCDPVLVGLLPYLSVKQPAHTSTEPSPAPPQRVVRWVWLLLSLVVWLAVIAVNSTDVASGAHTDALLLKFVRLFFPEAGRGSAAEGFDVLSLLVRKLGHVVEYAVLGALLARAARWLVPGFVRGRGWELLWRMALAVVPFGIVVALADEFHQTFVASRFGKLSDVAIDLTGLVAGVVMMWLVWRRRSGSMADNVSLGGAMDGAVVATSAEQSRVARERIRPRRILAGLDVFAGCVCLVWLEALLSLRLHETGLARVGYLVGILLGVVITLLLVFRDGQYSRAMRMSRLADIGGLLKNVVIAFAVSLILGYLTKGFGTGLTSPSRLVTVSSVLVFFVLTFAARLVLHGYQRRQFAKGIGIRRLMVLGVGKAADDFATFIADRPWLGAACVGRLTYSSEPVSTSGESVAPAADEVRITDTLQGLGDLNRALRASGANEVIVALDDEERQAILHVTKLLSLAHVKYSIVPSLFECSFHAAVLDRFGELPVVNVEVDPLNRVQRLFKRVFDVAVASSAIVVFFLPGLVINLAIALEDGFPIFYTQERVGRNGRHFPMLKFRTMVKDADDLLSSLADKNETGSELMFKIKDDPRVTKVGKWLRRTSLDEMPQVINVLRGEMSVVGPRPPLPSEVSKYEEHHYSRLRCTPGMTGLWQVSGRSGLGFDDMVKLDRYYLENWSLRLDMGIVLRTFLVVLRRTGAC